MYHSSSGLRRRTFGEVLQTAGIGLEAGLDHGAACEVLDAAQEFQPERFLLAKCTQTLGADDWAVDVRAILVDEVVGSDRGILQRLETPPMPESEAAPDPGAT